ncbi:MAG: TIGR03854 family LLM class F420-dependent oxidoreductase [bacterium]|nr:TIGR03854 family LLM class F420-dependent oxidoreductase [bacterium]MCY3633302.1 TIGR03854 family LLM class F420-dependent oxidoreductase [bacterium]
MRVRIGVGIGGGVASSDRDTFATVVDSLERLGFDSLWVAERASGPALDPVVSMTFAAARTTRLKFGPSVMVLPGRNPVLLAKAMASLDRISNGRLLPAFGLGVADTAEHQAFGVARMDRAAWFNEALPLMRRLWTEDVVEHHGPRFHLDAAQVDVKPVQQPLDVWMGGIAPSELRRVGRLSDGWLPSFVTPDDVRTGIATVKQHADEAGREIDPEHYGVLLAYTDGPLPDRFLKAIKLRQPDKGPGDLVASNRQELRAKIEAFIETGASKFVVMPLGEPPDWEEEIEALATDLLPMQD